MRQDLINNRVNKLGEINYNSCGDKMEIIKYIDTLNVIIKFENDYKTKVTYYQFKNGQIKNPYQKSVYGIGYLGEGDYKTKVNGKKTRQYIKWFFMFNRCYTSSQSKYPTYINCTVCDEWHNFQVFAKWYDENYYEVNNEVMELDKDILIKGNKIYSPETCVFVPNNVNNLFTKHDSKRGDYPIGVYYMKDRNKYRAQCSKEGEQYLGDYNTPEEAFNQYKITKESYIKELAERYKDKIPKKLYDALIKYEVSIND